jgi:hypothetical protein
MRKFGFFLLSGALLLTAPIASQATDASGLPNSSLTPGAINLNVNQSNIMSTICVSGFTKTIRPPANYTTKLKIRQLKSGYTFLGLTLTKFYEEDHLIPLEIVEIQQVS